MRPGPPGAPDVVIGNEGAARGDARQVAHDAGAPATLLHTVRARPSIPCPGLDQIRHCVTEGGCICEPLPVNAMLLRTGP